MTEKAATDVIFKQANATSDQMYATYTERLHTYDITLWFWNTIWV